MKNTLLLTTLLGAAAILTACQKAEDPAAPKPLQQAPVPDTACADCKWENFVARPIPVQRIECTNEGKPEHCHLTTENFQPKREVTVTYDPNTGAYNWQLATPEKPGERMDCPNLAVNKDNRRVIEGTCIIPDSDQGPQVHFFRATVVPKEDEPTKGQLSAQFRHTPFDSASQPVHDGTVHTH